MNIVETARGKAVERYFSPSEESRSRIQANAYTVGYCEGAKDIANDVLKIFESPHSETPDIMKNFLARLEFLVKQVEGEPKDVY